MATIGRTLLKVGASLVAVVLVASVAGFLWAKSAANGRLERTYETHRVDFPIPFPLSEKELEALRAERAGDAQPTAAPEGEAPLDPLAGVDLEALALERAIERGKHLVEARYACIECHAADFGGGTMIDDPAVGQILGPNLTGGEGSRIASFTPADWDRIVRHGVLPDGKPAIMPSQDFLRMSDRELSDVIAYIRSHPQVDRQMAPRSLGPLGYVLTAAGQVLLTAETIPDHEAAHSVEPPSQEDALEFGRHLAQTCTGCHTATFTGGPIPGGPPDWAPASNLTPHAEGLAGWTLDEFKTVLRTGKRRDGSPLAVPMNTMVPAAQKMSDAELSALFTFLQSLPPTAAK